MELRVLLKRYRRDHGLSQREFARQCNLSHALISLLEMGENPQTGKAMSPDLETYQKLAGGMGITTDQLFAEMEEHAPGGLLRVSVPAGKRLFAVDSLPDGLRKIGPPYDSETKELLEGWVVIKPESRKAVLGIVNELKRMEGKK